MRVMIIILCVASLQGNTPMVRRTWSHADVLQQLYSKTKTTDMTNVFQNDADYNRVVAAEKNVMNNFENR